MNRLVGGAPALAGTGVTQQQSGKTDISWTGKFLELV